MDEQNLFLKIIEERFDRFLDSYIVTGGDFLSPEEQSHAASFFRRNASQGAFLYGGYEEAERRMPVFMPDYTYVTDEDSLIKSDILDFIVVIYDIGPTGPEGEIIKI